MESKSKRKESYRNERNLSPERSSGIKRSSKCHEQSLEYKNSRAEEMNGSTKRKYKVDTSKHNESRQSKDFGLKTRDRSALKEAISSQGSYSTKESTGFNNRRNPQSKEAVEINGSVERNKREYSRNYEIRPDKGYGLKSPDRSRPKDPSPRQKSQFMRKNTDSRKFQSKEVNTEMNGSVERNDYSKNYEIRPHREYMYKDYGSKSEDRRHPKDPRNSRDSRKSHRKEAVYRQLNEMLQMEQHHTRYVDRSTSGEIKFVLWCPQYINPDIRGHVRGGTSLLHHRCRKCRKICFHLLGQPGTTRLCLGCSGYKEKYIPDWYYHKRCKYCQ
ncbi:Hypothetical predicted protein [Paramuricea clavata]|uniref:Uncharacterized protein n=1 Tax=Paramuricea clavata TaxID=317549 RepID=A0A7D9DFT3_PARCT|nr:Hypothetical predicted protein [Paramuricea clavata]